MKDLSIIIPFKDERDRLPSTVARVLDYMSHQTISFELILVDDGSCDRTREALESYAGQIILLTHTNNQGKGAAIATGVRASQGARILFMDADLATPIEEYNVLVKKMVEGVDVVFGSRGIDREQVKRRQPMYRVWIGRTGNWLIRTILGLPYKDTQCGFKLFRQAVAQDLFANLQFPRWSFDFEVLHKARRAGYHVVECPVTWYAQAGSKFHPIKDSVRCLVDILRIRFG